MTTSPQPSVRRWPVVRNGDALLRHPKEHLGLPNAEVREGLIAYKIAARLTSPSSPRRTRRDDELGGLATTLIGTSSSSCLWILSGPRNHDETLPADIYKQAEFCSMCGPKHCPMQTKITDEDLEGLEQALASKGGAAELTPVKLDKAD